MRSRTARDPSQRLALALGLVLAVLVSGCEDAAPTLPLRFEEHLSLAGLYDDILAKEVVPDALEFSPAHALWSDGAEKRRWILLPKGGVIDTADPDHWRFPIGTRFFKEFALDGRRLETRLILRVGDTGDAEKDYLLGAYLWDDAERDAHFVEGGADNVRGTQHDVPARTTCWRCHVGEPGHVLGFSAVQLATSTAAVTLATLTAQNKLSAPVSGPVAVPGDATTVAAIGWLHANCGHCHNEHGNSWPQTSMVLQLGSRDRVAEDTALYRTTVGVALNYYRSPGLALRIAPGDPDSSAIVHRDAARGNVDQMPPLATETPDSAGLAAVRDWVGGLKP